MKIIKSNLPQDLQMCKVEILADLHIGSNKCDYKAIKERIKTIAENPGTYCIILGDVINNSTKTSVGDVYEQPLSPMQQIVTAVELFEPIKDKILAVTSGNHERRSYKTEGVDLLHFMCAELGILDRYDYCATLLFLRVGRDKHQDTNQKQRQVAYTLYMTHGDGQGGRTIGGKANGLERRGQIVNADIVVTGHTHAPLTFKNKCFEVNYQNSCVIEHEQVFVNASATLDYEEYAELYGMRPSSKASPAIMLGGRKKEIKVVI